MDPAIRRKRKKAQNNVTVDRISSLEDSVLLHILAFLPTREAVGTSILSRRWLNLWYELPVLDFVWDSKPIWERTGEYANRKVSFKSCINRVLLLSSSLHIKYFRLAHVREFDAAQMTAWITVLSERHVEEMALFECVMDINGPYAASFRRKFVFEQLLVLKLSYVDFKFDPSLVQFQLPNLKTLRLWYVCCSSDKLLSRLITGCPKLEELAMLWSFFETIEIDCSTLFSLTIISGQMPSVPTITLDAPNLKSLALKGVDLAIKSAHLPALTMASVSVSSSSLKCLKSISKTRILCLLFDSAAYGLGFESLPQFCYVTYLNLKLAIYHEPNIVIALSLLNCCPNLQNFELCFDHPLPSEIEWVSPQCVPQCLISTLEVFSICASHPHKAHLNLLEYFLKNANLLKEVKVCIFIDQPEKKCEFLEKVLMFQRASGACTVRVSASTCESHLS